MDLPAFANQLLVAACGICGYLAVHHLWVWNGRRRDPLHLWMGLWCVASGLLQLGRMLQYTTPDPHVALQAALLSESMIVVLFVVLGVALRTLTRLPVSPRSLAALLVPSAAALLVLWATPFVLTGEVVRRADAWGRTFHHAQAGRLAALIALPYAAMLLIYYATLIRRAATLSPATRRAFLTALAVYAALGLNDLLFHLGWTAFGFIGSVTLFEYAFAALAIACDHLVVTRYHQMHSYLEETNSKLSSTLAWLRHDEEQLEETTQKLNSILASSTEYAILATDLHLVITHCNPAVEWLLARPPSRVVGRPLAEFDLDGTLDPGAWHDAATTARRLGKWEQDVELRRDGDSTAVQLTVMPMRCDGDTCAGYLLFATDITERRRNEEALRRAKEAAEAASRLKTRFVANVSHEIRTPLNCIIGFAEIITHTPDVAAARQYARNVLQESVTLLNLINDLLDHAKIEAGKLELNPHPFDLHELVHSAVGGSRIEARIRGLILGVELEDAVPRWVRADALRLRQILMNLVSNAVKFTERGSVSVSVTCDTPHDTRTLCRFSVTDTGIGIPPEKQATIFESFTQADSGTSRKYGGTGLGTTIARQLVELMGGRIGVQSTPGHGSTFWFTLPLEPCTPPDRLPAPAGEPAALTPPAPPPSATRGRILLAEDYPPNQRVVRMHLESAGHHVDVVSDGEAAVQACMRNFYDLILLDVQMPVTDGYTAARRIRDGQGPCADVPILALTAHADADSRQACEDAGMNGVITKPVRRDTFLAVVNRWLSVRGEVAPPPPSTDAAHSADEPGQPFPTAARPPASSDPPAQAPPDTAGETPLDYDTAVRQFGSVDNVEQVVVQFLKLVEQQIAVMRVALQESDCERLRKEAHSIKGAALTLAARPLAEAAARLEGLSRQRLAEGLNETLSLLMDEFRRLRSFVEVRLDSQRDGG